MRPVSQLMIMTLLSTASCSDDAATVGPSEPTIASTEVSHDVVINQPLDLPDWFIPCVNGGAGELVDFTGVFSGVLHVTVNGTRFLSSVAGTSRLEGKGESTGAPYHFRDVFASSQSQSLLNEQLSFTSNFTTVITTAGPGNNVLLRGTSHLTRDPNGEIRVNFDNISFGECR